LPTELPIRTGSTPASELELLVLVSLVPSCLSLLLAFHDPAIAHAFLFMGRLG
jgi:hypothetical protein